MSLHFKVMTCRVYHLKASCGVTGLLQVTIEQTYLIKLKFCLDIKKPGHFTLLLNHLRLKINIGRNLYLFVNAQPWKFATKW